MERRGWPTSCLHGWLHLYPNIRTCIPLPLRAKSACSTQSAVAFYHLAERQSVHHWVSEFICVCICVSSSIVAHTHLFVCLWINTSLLHCLIYLQTDSSLLCSPSLSSFIHTYTPSHVHQCICLRMELPSRIMGRDWSLCPCLWRPKKGHCFIANMKRYDPTSHSPLESSVNLRCLCLDRGGNNRKYLQKFQACRSIWDLEPSCCEPTVLSTTQQWSPLGQPTHIISSFHFTPPVLPTIHHFIFICSQRSTQFPESQRG